MAKDFSPPPAGRRLRIPLNVYDRPSGLFRTVPGKIVLVTVSGEEEEARLWKAVETAVGDGAWRDDRTAGGNRRAAGPQNHV